MREMLLLAIVVVICAIAVVKPKYGLMGLMWFTLMRPDVLAWSQRVIPYSLMLEVATGLGSLKYLSRVPFVLKNPISLTLLILQIPVTLSMLFAVDFWLSAQSFNSYVGGIFSALLIPLLIQTEEEFRELMLVVTLSFGLLSCRFGLFGFIHGGVRLSLGYGAMLSDNNTLALFIVMTVPLAWFARDLVQSKWIRVGLIGIVFTSIGGAVFTYSRGAAVALVGCLLAMAYYSKHKLLMLVCLSILTVPAVYLVYDSYMERMQTLEDPESEQSARDRIENVRVAFRIAKDYPLLGVGFGMDNQVRIWPKYANQDVAGENSMVIHNTYLQVLTDSGIPAAIIYFCLLWGTIYWLHRSARRMLKLGCRFGVYPMGIGASLVAFAIGSTFLSRVTFDAEYILLMCAAAWWNLERDCLHTAEQEQEALPAEELMALAANPA